MKRAKSIVVVSFIVSLLISIGCFIKALMSEVDAYDFGQFYRFLNPGKIFFLTAVALLITLSFFKRKEEIEIEKFFTVIFVIIAIGFGAGYISSNFGNGTMSASVHQEQTEKIDNYEAYNLHKNYLPFYDEYSSNTIKGSYEIYKGNLKNTVMIYVNSDIIGSEYNMYYEMEFLHTKNILLYQKFVSQKLYFDKTSVVVNGKKNTYYVGIYQVNIYKDNSNYVASIRDGNEFMCITLFDAKEITEKDLIDVCVEQYELMKKTLDNGHLLVIPN